MEILKNAGFSFTCGRTQTEVFEYDDVIHYILPPSGWILSYFHPFSVFMWKGEKDSNTLRWDTYFLKTDKKNFRFENIRIRVDRTEAWIVVSNSVTKSVFQDCVLCLESSQSNLFPGLHGKQNIKDYEARWLPRWKATFNTNCNSCYM